MDSSGWRLIDELLLLDGVLSFGFDNFEDISKVLNFKEEAEIKSHLYSNPNDSCVASFMSKREEFDSLILNDYETLIDDLVFEDDDSELEIEFKKFLVENYRTVLMRREIWKEFILDRKFTEMVKLKAKENSELEEAIFKKKWIAQYLSKNDFNVFIAGLAIEYSCSRRQ